jgi:prepilin-type N-terminal cleavage/methylation domain-containing protein
MKTQITRRRRGFTLIELLVVIAIIAVLAAAGFTAGAAALNRARKTTAQADAVAVQQAVDAFYSEYGILPFSGDPPTQVKTDGGDGVEMLEVLLARETGASPVNTRGIRFLNVKEGKKKGTGGSGGLVYDDKQVRGLYDPWGNGYTVVFNSQYEDSFSFTPEGLSTSVTLNGRNVAVYSTGVPEGEKVTNSTLVKSW